MKLYFVKMTSADKNEEFWKVGWTNHERVLDRFYRHGKVPLKESSLTPLQQLAYRLHGYKHAPDFPYLVDLVHETRLHVDVDPLVPEGELLGALGDAKYVPNQYFSGQGECFKIDEEGRRLIVEFMNLRAQELNDAVLVNRQQ